MCIGAFLSLFCRISLTTVQRLSSKSCYSRYFGELPDTFDEGQLAGIRIESLETIARKLLKLKNLTISLAASDTANLAPSEYTFPHGFKELNLRYSFLDFIHFTFEGDAAARYISSFFRSADRRSRRFTYEYDWYVKWNLQGSPGWDSYGNSYSNLFKEFEKKVRSYIDTQPQV